MRVEDDKLKRLCQHTFCNIKNFRILLRNITTTIRNTKFRIYRDCETTNFTTPCRLLYTKELKRSKYTLLAFYVQEYSTE